MLGSCNRDALIAHVRFSPIALECSATESKCRAFECVPLPLTVDCLLPDFDALTIIHRYCAYCVYAMDQTFKTVSTGSIRLLILPHRSLSRAGLWLFLAAQSIAAGGFAGLAAWRGNVFAPAFAILELGVVAYCLSRVWRASGTGDVITLSASMLEIGRMGDSAPPLQFHPYWAQLRLQPGRWRGWPSRLLLRSHGRSAEIGAFLNDAERAELAQRLSMLLARYKDGPASERNFVQGETNDTRGNKDAAS